jgi:RHS repeat-associated protein
MGEALRKELYFKGIFLYTGQEWDAETGLYYFGARYYNPIIGRFITEDPIAGLASLPQSLNPYAYCLNDPLNYVDPEGEFVVLALTLIGALAGAYGGYKYAEATGEDLFGTVLFTIMGAVVGGVAGNFLGAAIVGEAIGVSVGIGISTASGASFMVGVVSYGGSEGTKAGFYSLSAEPDRPDMIYTAAESHSPWEWVNEWSSTWQAFWDELYQSWEDITSKEFWAEFFKNRLPGTRWFSFGELAVHIPYGTMGSISTSALLHGVAERTSAQVTRGVSSFKVTSHSIYIKGYNPMWGKLGAGIKWTGWGLTAFYTGADIGTFIYTYWKFKSLPKE